MQRKLRGSGEVEEEPRFLNEDTRALSGRACRRSRRTARPLLELRPCPCDSRSSATEVAPVLEIHRGERAMRNLDGQKRHDVTCCPRTQGYARPACLYICVIDLKMATEAKTPLGGTYEGVFSTAQLMSRSPVYIWRPEFILVRDANVRRKNNIGKSDGKISDGICDTTNKSATFAGSESRAAWRSALFRERPAAAHFHWDEK